METSKSFYVIFQKEVDRGKALPRFVVQSEPPNHNHRVYKLEIGDCIDAARIFFGDDSLTWTRIDLYRITNVNGYPADIQFLETYTMPYVR